MNVPARIGVMCTSNVDTGRMAGSVRPALPLHPATPS
jgi:hypothetical protein